MSKLFKYLLATLFAVCATFPAYASAKIELPALISDGAVLQRDRPIPVWGKAPANTAVSATLGDRTQKTSSDSDGNWSLQFDALPAGGPLTLTVSAGPHSRQVKDLYLGDVWVASGQSNMEWLLHYSEGVEDELAAPDMPQVRHYKVPLSWSSVPASELAGGQWQPATQSHKGNFSAVAYFFAKTIHAETGVPIGLIGSNWGGSAIEAWMSPEALNKSPQQTQEFIEQIGTETRQESESIKRTLQRWPGTVVEQLGPDLIALARGDWSGSEVDTQDWLTLEAPSLWEQQGFPGMDGVVWYRKTFSLSEAEAAEPLELRLARIDDRDTTWVNGHKVGSTDAYDLRRQYTVPETHLKAGSNVIAIRVEDTGGGGGIYSSADLLYLETTAGRRSLAGSWQVRPDKVALGPIGNMNQIETALYNKMLHPLLRVPIKGVLWYQGESNANTLEQASHYADQFQAMIKDWRKGWQQPQMPFYWVQLANFNSMRNTEAGKPWAVIRESQTAALALPNTGQAITIDVGDPDDIHPRDKKTVGQRLALIALNQTYGQKDVHYRVPVFAGVEIKENSLVVTFDAAKPLTLADDQKTVQGFEVIGSDGTAKAVQGKLRGRSVVIETENPGNLTEVRYAWDDNPEDANLADTKGLPAEPFRTEIE